VHDPHGGDVIVPGEKVFLGQPSKDLLPVFRRWVNDLRVSYTLSIISEQGLPLTDQDEEDWFNGMRKDRSQVVFTIYEQSSGRAVGNVSLGGVGSLNRSAEIGIVIGERSVWGRGYATEAMALMVDYGFTMLGLHHIWLRYLATNDAARRVYDRVGFKEAGRMRESWLLGGTFHDVVLMDILTSEFESPVLAGHLGLGR
jgi:RimJ/RimL family protein N-acetyltransferase